MFAWSAGSPVAKADSEPIPVYQHTFCDRDPKQQKLILNEDILVIWIDLKEYQDASGYHASLE